jgi:hypothetical protein
MPPPCGAWLPTKVLLLMVAIPLLKLSMAPPYPWLAELFRKVEPETVRVPPSLLMAPPEAIAWLALKVELVTVSAPWLTMAPPMLASELPYAAPPVR